MLFGIAVIAGLKGGLAKGVVIGGLHIGDANANE